jgi:Family of unknown function (DUF5670)
MPFVKAMLWTSAVVLIILWVVAFAVLELATPLVHVLLALAALSLLAQLVTDLRAT